MAFVFSSRPIKMSPRFVLGRENVPCVAEVVNRSLKADCTDFTLRSHDDLLSRGNNIIAPGQARGQLITMNLSEFVSFLHKLLQRMNFKHVYLLWCFLELFIGKFIPNIYNEREQTTLAPEQLLRSVHLEKSYLGKAGYLVL